MLVTSSLSHDITSNAFPRHPQRCCYHEFLAPVVSPYTCWQMQLLLIYQWALHLQEVYMRKTKPFTHPSFSICQAHQEEEHEAMLTDWRADEHCNIALRRQHSQFLQQTLIWSKVVLLAIYFSWSHRKRVSVSVLNLTSTCCPQENQGQINDFQRQDSFFFSGSENDFVLMNNTGFIRLT